MHEYLDQIDAAEAEAQRQAALQAAMDRARR